MWFEPDCLRRLAECIDPAARVGAADGWHFGYDNPAFLHGCTRFRPARWAINSPHPRRAADFTVRAPAGAFTPFPCAGAVMIHRDAYLDAGGWDTGFFLDHEDIDLFIRLWQRGWKCACVPDAVVHHAVNASNAQTLTALNVTVSHRRYLSQRSSLAVIAAKYFSARMLPLAALMWPATFLNNLVRLRHVAVWRDMLVLGQIARRLPEARRFRRANAAFNRSHPGERFFTEPGFSSET
jgi:GT2 family glycosyltransferase